ncbi:MAG: response regulator [Desulfobulbaceae bacterium]|nr:response regulator [Desulfobulbaceae bacterium]
MNPEDVINGIPHPVAILDAQLRVSSMNCKLEAITGHASGAVKGIRAEHVIRFNFGTGGIEKALQGEQPLTREGDIIKNHDPAIEIIMLTGHGSTASGIEGMKKGLFDYLMKPVDIGELVIKINEAAAVKNSE